MRYIKTKDGKIYDINKCASENFPFDPKHSMSWEFEDGAVVNEHDIIAQADTIEELCETTTRTAMNGLEALEIVKYECGFAFGQTGNGDRVRESLPIIEKDLKDGAKCKKALEIIKKSISDVTSLDLLLRELLLQRKITPDELGLLMEVLK